jgi:hypothetical protein
MHRHFRDFRSSREKNDVYFSKRESPNSWPTRIRCSSVLQVTMSCCICSCHLCIRVLPNSQGIAIFVTFAQVVKRMIWSVRSPHLTIIGGHACDITVCSGQRCCNVSIGVIYAFICFRNNDILILHVNCTWVVMKGEESHIPTQWEKENEYGDDRRGHIDLQSQGFTLMYHTHARELVFTVWYSSHGPILNVYDRYWCHCIRNSGRRKTS